LRAIELVYPFFSDLVMISSICRRSSLDFSMVIYLICSRKASRLRRTSSRNALSRWVESSAMWLNSDEPRRAVEKIASKDTVAITTSPCMAIS
jgi:hypothetical protein